MAIRAIAVLAALLAISTPRFVLAGSGCENIVINSTCNGDPVQCVIEISSCPRITHRGYTSAVLTINCENGNVTSATVQGGTATITPSKLNQLFPGRTAV
jgi:hypothetical protein